jgi:hypothetical protein
LPLITAVAHGDWRTAPAGASPDPHRLAKRFLTRTALDWIAARAAWAEGRTVSQVSKSVNDLSKLVSSGRAGKGIPASRAEVLASLLRKRATAWRDGLSDLEGRLRNQILWSLPVERPQDRDAAGEAVEPRDASHATPDGD